MPMVQNKRRYERHAAAFKRIFGISLQPFFDLVIGFDIVKFDETVVKPVDGVSTSDTVQQRWGDEGVNVILALIGGD